jgi:beta-glucosidase
MDMEMGTRPPYASNYLGEPFLHGLNTGRYPMSVLDDKVRRHLYVMFKLNLIRDPAETNAPPEPAGPLSTPEHQDAARRIAEASIVLLKNNGLLPLDSSRVKSIAVIGANAAAEFAHGGGSANIKAPFEITALQGISNRAGANVHITYSPGYIAIAGRGGRRGGGAALVAPTANSSNLVADAVAAAKAADVVIFVGGLNHNGGYDAEGADRPNLKLPGGQDELLQKIVAANPKTVVVLMGGGAVEMGSWLEKTPAVLYGWYGGMEAGHALANVLFGDVDPCGKLPCTFPRQLADSPAHALGAYPGTNDTETYSEGLLVGYRWFDTKNIEPLFPFGHGLSYTTFKYSGLTVTPASDAKNPAVTVEFELANSGRREGAEVAQVYVQEVNPPVTRPAKELKGFAKVFLKPGEKQKVSVRLDQAAFARYDPDQKGWVADKGDFNIIIGSSSRDLRLHGKCRLAETVFQAD